MGLDNLYQHSSRLPNNERFQKVMDDYKWLRLYRFLNLERRGRPDEEGINDHYQHGKGISDMECDECRTNGLERGERG